MEASSTNVGVVLPMKCDMTTETRWGEETMTLELKTKHQELIEEGVANPIDKLCEEFCNLLPGAVMICGDGAETELLMEEGLASVDAFVPMTGTDEENILLSCFANTQEVPKVICKVNRKELSTLAGKLGLDSMVSPQKLISNVLTRYARALENSLGSNVETLYKIMDGKAEALEFNVQSDFRSLEVPLKEMKLKDNVLIAGIIRGRKTIIPAGGDVIRAGDRVIVLSTEHRLNDLSDIIA
jgi:trk system potassium uptake protein TrkA